MDRCVVLSLGEMPYVPAWDLQKDLHRRVADGVLPNLLLLLEHPHVYTLGRRGEAADILVDAARLTALGAEVHHTDLGGQATYHGPGQLVGYPILDLRRWGGGPLRYVRALEETIISTIAQLGLVAGGEQKPTGVWVGHAKIAAIGAPLLVLHGERDRVVPVRFGRRLFEGIKNFLRPLAQTKGVKHSKEVKSVI